MAFAGKDANVKITSVTATTSTGEASTLATDGYSVQVDDVLKRHWDPTSATRPVLYHNTTAVTPGLYDVNYVQGKFEFTSTQPVGTYTSDVEYLTASKVAGGREWNLNVETAMFEISEFGSSGWRTFQPNMTGAGVTISRYWNDSSFLDMLTNESRFVVELFPNDAGGWKYEAFARPRSDQVGASVDSIVGEAVQLQVDGKLYFST